VILQGVEIQIEVELDGQEEAEIVYGALKPEIKSSPSSRTRSWVKIKDKKTHSGSGSQGFHLAKSGC